jgi:ATP-dependent Clp protease adapter protein ClpS
MKNQFKVMNNGSQGGNEVLVKERVADKTVFVEQEDEVIVDDRMYKILLMNNDETSEIAVRDVLTNVFGHEEDMCMQIMMDAHTNGSAIVWIETENNCRTKLTETMTYCGQLNGETIEGCDVGMDDGQGDRPHHYGELEFVLEEYEEDQNN